MSSIAFARQTKTTGYGRDTLFSYGQTANGEVIDFTADRIMSMRLAWIQSPAAATAEVNESVTPFRRSDLLAAADAAGISTGVLRGATGSSHLFNPIIDLPAAAAATAIDAVSKAGPEPISEDAAGKIMSAALGRPSGAHLRGGNVINGDGTIRTALQLPRLVVVQIFAPGERRSVVGDTVGEKTVAAIEKARTIDELLKASEPAIESLAARESLVSDILEMREDLTLMSGLLPGADNGLAIPYESTNKGFVQATSFANQVREILPDIRVSVARAWKRV